MCKDKCSECQWHDYNWSATVRYVAASLKLSYSTTHHAITDVLGYNKVCARWYRECWHEKTSKSVWPHHMTISVSTTQIQESFSTDMPPWTRLGLIILIPRPSSRASNWSMSTHRSQSSFARLPLLAVMASVFWDSEGVLTTWSEVDCYWCLLCWSRNFSWPSRRNNAESWVTVCCFIMTMHLPTPLTLPLPQFENVA